MSANKEIVRVLGELRGGLVAIDASQKLEDVVRACQASGKKGTITITLTVQPVGSGNVEMNVSAKVAAKAPADPNIEERSIFFAQNGQLVRHDPRQGQLYGGPKLAADGSSPGEQGFDEGARFASNG